MIRSSTRAPRGIGTVALMAIMFAFVVVGAPMVYFLWTTLNELLAGHVVPRQLAIAAGILLLFVGVLFILSVSVRRLDERSH